MLLCLIRGWALYRALALALALFFFIGLRRGYVAKAKLPAVGERLGLLPTTALPSILCSMALYNQTIAVIMLHQMPGIGAQRRPSRRCCIRSRFSICSPKRDSFRRKEPEL